jgi:hypothetical protein
MGTPFSLHLLPELNQRDKRYAQVLVTRNTGLEVHQFRKPTRGIFSKIELIMISRSEYPSYHLSRPLRLRFFPDVVFSCLVLLFPSPYGLI